MGLANICDCGHLASDHQAKSIKGEHFRAWCDWDECECPKFNLNHKLAANYKNNFAQNVIDLEPMFIPNHDDLELPRYERLRSHPMLIADCTKEGFGKNNLYDRKPKYNHGEYP